MASNYEILTRENLSRFFSRLPDQAETRLGASRVGDIFLFKAFGEECRLSSNGITLSDSHISDPRGLLVSLYALNAGPDPLQLLPFKSFKDLPHSMPYQGAFSANTEKVLIPHVSAINEKQPIIREVFDGKDAPPESAGDFSFILFPLPKIALCYIFYLPDEEFPASATCLFSANALSFMPLDGLADVGEYTSREILQITTAQ